MANRSKKGLYAFIVIVMFFAAGLMGYLGGVYMPYDVMSGFLFIMLAVVLVILATSFGAVRLREKPTDEDEDEDEDYDEEEEET